MTFQRLSEQLAHQPQSIMIWGAAGTGKTVLMGTAGDDSLFINNGMGGETLKSKWFRDTYKCNPFVVDIPFDTPTAKTGESSWLKLINTLDEALANKDIRTISLDDGTAFRMSSMIRAMEYNSAEGKSKTLAAAKKFDVIVPVVQDFGTEMEHTRQFIAWLISECKEQNKNFIMGAHIRRMFAAPKRIGDPPNHLGDVPAFTGADKNPDMLSGLFDWVFYSQVKGDGEKRQYSVRTEGDELLQAKSRHKGLVPSTWVSPDLRVLFKKIEESGR